MLEFIVDAWFNILGQHNNVYNQSVNKSCVKNVTLWWNQNLKETVLLPKSD